jgi:hypothetical protein
MKVEKAVFRPFFCFGKKGQDNINPRFGFSVRPIIDAKGKENFKNSPSNSISFDRKSRLKLLCRLNS